MKRSSCVVVIVALTGFITSCKHTQSDVSTIQETDLPDHFVSVSIPSNQDIQYAVQLLHQYSDTANAAWLELNHAHTLYLEHMEELISLYQKGTGNQFQVNELKQLWKEVHSNPLTMSSQYNNTYLDHTTLLTDSLTSNALLFYVTMKSFRKATPSMLRLVQMIQQDEKEIKFRRERYNELAKRYNDFFWEKRTFLLQARGELPARPIRACFRDKV
jgi:hypothetical protein